MLRGNPRTFIPTTLARGTDGFIVLAHFFALGATGWAVGCWLGRVHGPNTWFGRVCGQLAIRMNDDGVAGRIRAKTGTLIEANSLSGFIMTEKGRVLAFSILVDHIDVGTTTNMRSVIDNFLVSLIKL